ncbi:uncharacterized protein [Miscanthus floridulus]|uniref:uncharacterized protein n=1 Tax=Miscanthus floridulus TaxID=154761 RepID=UPI0034576886
MSEQLLRMQVHLSKKMTSVRAGYVDPQCIAATCFNYAKDWKLDGKELAAGKMVEEKEKIRQKKIREASLKAMAYIALAFKNLQNNSAIWLAYNFDNHWICIGVNVGLGMAWVFDSIDKDPTTYKDFITILKTAYRFYVNTHHGRHDPEREPNLCVKTLCACPKQKPGSVHCGYYICTLMSNSSAYKRPL